MRLDKGKKIPIKLEWDEAFTGSDAIEPKISYFRTTRIIAF